MYKIVSIKGETSLRGEDWEAGKLERVMGFLERWYSGGLKRDNGVRVGTGKLKLAGLILSGSGIPLTPVLTYGITLQDVMYDNESALVSGAVVTYSKRREFLPKPKKILEVVPELPPLRVSKGMPKHILTIVAGKPDMILDVAKQLRVFRKIL
ncbi:hypothetical protein K8R30_04385 [archaeon]|nr:hypothetical protein [archaeon]